MRTTTIALLAVALLGVSPAAALAGLTEWQSAVGTGTPAGYVGTNLSAPSNPSTVDIGSYDETANGGVTYEMIVNGTAQGLSSAMVGVNDGAASERGAYKFEQYSNTGNYGITQFSVADYNSGIALTENADIHLVFVNNGASTDLYIDGTFATAVSGANVEIDGTVGVGGAYRITNGTFFDVFDGSVLGLAVYDSALGAREIGDHYDAYTSVVPEPATLALLSLAACGLGGYVRRRRKA